MTVIMAAAPAGSVPALQISRSEFCWRGFYPVSRRLSLPVHEILRPNAGSVPSGAALRDDPAEPALGRFEKTKRRHGPGAAQDLEDAATIGVVEAVEALQVLQKAPRRVLQAREVAVFAGDLRGADQPVVADRFAFAGLLRFQDAQDAHENQASRERSLLHQDQHVQRVAVLG